PKRAGSGTSPPGGAAAAGTPGSARPRDRRSESGTAGRSEAGSALRAWGSHPRLSDFSGRSRRGKEAPDKEKAPPTRRETHTRMGAWSLRASQKRGPRTDPRALAPDEEGKKGRAKDRRKPANARTEHERARTDLAKGGRDLAKNGME